MSKNLLTIDYKDNEVVKSLKDFDNVTITKENVHEYELAYINEYGDLSNPESLFYENDDYENINVVTEANSINKIPVEKEIWYVSYPFNNMKQIFKNRPCVFINVNNELKAVYLSSYQENKSSKVKKAGYSYISLLRDWKYEGLSKPTLVCGFSRRSIQEITLLNKIGTISDYDYGIALHCIKTFDELKYDNPYNYLNWLLSNNIKDTIPVYGSNNNVNPLQTIYDIEMSKHANCVDIANAIHYICKNNNDIHWIVDTSFYIDISKKSSGHVYTPWYWNNAHHVLFYMGDTEYNIGEIHNYEQSHIKEVIYNETMFLKPHFTEIFGHKVKDISFIIPHRGLTKWDMFVKTKSSQQDLLHYYFPKR